MRRFPRLRGRLAALLAAAAAALALPLRPVITTDAEIMDEVFGAS